MNHIKTTPRRHVLALAAAGVLVLSACGSGDGEGAGANGGEGGDSTVRVAVFPSFNALGARTAEAEGIFKEEGLTVEFVTVATPAEATPQLLGGKIDFALMDMTVPILARSEDVPLKFVAPGAQGTALREDGMGVGNFWVAKDSKIKSVKDIENSTFGIPQTRSQIWLDVRQAVDDAGGDSSKIKFVETPNTLAALRSGSVDVVTTAEPGGTAALSDKTIHRLEGFIPAGEGKLGYGYVTTDQYAQQNKDAVNKFRDAILKANEELNGSDTLAAEVAGTYVEAPKELLSKAMYANFGEEAVSATNVEDAIARMVKYGMLKQDDAPAAADLVVGE